MKLEIDLLDQHGDGGSGNLMVEFFFTKSVCWGLYFLTLVRQSFEKPSQCWMHDTQEALLKEWSGRDEG